MYIPYTHTQKKITKENNREKEKKNTHTQIAKRGRQSWCKVWKGKE